MPGETNLSTVLQSLKVSCDDIEYGFATVPSIEDIEINKVLGIFHESEGVTILARADYFKDKNIEFLGPVAKLTIEVHTSLELVGLTAVLAKQLADKGISANVVAAYHHDHIFVSYTDRQNAIKALEDLKT